MATYEKNNFEDANVGIRTTAEFEVILKFIHAYNREKSLGVNNGLSEIQFAEYVCGRAGLNSALAQDYLDRAKALNQNHRVGEVPNESDEKTLCEDFRAYATAEVEAKAKERDDINERLNEERNYVAEYNRAVRTVQNARRSVWGPFALFGAIGFASAVVLTAVIPAISGITMLGGVFTTGFTGLATVVTSAIGGIRGLFGEGGRIRKYQDARDALNAKRQPELAQIESEKARIERELTALERANFKGKDSVSSKLYTMVANDKIGFKNDIENIYNSVVAGNTGYLTAGIGKGESDRVKAEKQSIIDTLEALKNKADVSASDLVDARKFEAEANKFNVAGIQSKAQSTISQITANNDLIDEFVKTLPEAIKNKTEIKNEIDNIKSTINGYNATNIVLHENDTQAQLEQAESSVNYKTTLVKAEIAKAWAETNDKLDDGNSYASEYNAIVEAVKENGPYQKAIENNDRTVNDVNKTVDERESARKEVERIGVNTELLLVEARLMKALENAGKNGNAFKDVDGRKVSVVDFQNEINTAIIRVKSEILNFNNSATKPNLKNIAEVVTKIETNLVLQETEKKMKGSTISKKMRGKAKIQIESIYREIENAKKIVSYGELNSIFNAEVQALIAELEKTHTNSYYKQIDNLTDVSTFKSDTQRIIDNAKAQKDKALAKIDENKRALEEAKKNNAEAELKQKQVDAKNKIASSLDELKQEYEKLKNDGKLDELGAKEYENGFAEAGKELNEAIVSFSQDVESITDTLKLDEIIAGRGDFADYFAGLKTTFKEVGQRAEECKTLFSNCFNGSGSNVARKRKILEQELGKINGISDENKNNALDDFDSRIEIAKQLIETKKTEFTLDQLQQVFDDSEIDEFVAEVIEEAKEKTEQAKKTEDETAEKTEPIAPAVEQFAGEPLNVILEQAVENKEGVEPVKEESIEETKDAEQPEKEPVKDVDTKQFAMNLQKSMNEAKKSIKVTSMGVNAFGKGKEKDVTYIVPPMIDEDKKPSEVKKNTETTRSDAVTIVNKWIAKNRSTNLAKANLVGKFFNDKLAENYSDEATRTVIALALALQQMDEKATESNDEKEM